MMYRIAQEEPDLSALARGPARAGRRVPGQGSRTAAHAERVGGAGGGCGGSGGEDGRGRTSRGCRVRWSPGWGGMPWSCWRRRTPRAVDERRFAARTTAIAARGTGRDRRGGGGPRGARLPTDGLTGRRRGHSAAVTGAAGPGVRPGPRVGVRISLRGRRSGHSLPRSPRPRPLRPRPPAPPTAARAPAPPWSGTALIVAVALVLAGAGAATAYVLLEGRSGGVRSVEGDRPSARAGRTRRQPAQEGRVRRNRPGAGGIPADYLGTWETTVGGSSADVRRFRSPRASTGDTVLTMTATGPAYRCEFAATLDSAGPPVRLGPSTVTSGPAESCRPGPPSTLEMVDGKLRRAFDDGKAPLDRDGRAEVMRPARRRRPSVTGARRRPGDRSPVVVRSPPFARPAGLRSPS